MQVIQVFQIFIFLNNRGVWCVITLYFWIYGPKLIWFRKMNIFGFYIPHKKFQTNCNWFNFQLLIFYSCVRNQAVNFLGTPFVLKSFKTTIVRLKYELSMNLGSFWNEIVYFRSIWKAPEPHFHRAGLQESG